MANQAFDLIDANGDGVVDRTEFSELFKGGEGLPPSETMHRNAASVTRKLLMNVREENAGLQNERDQAVNQLRQKEAELRDMAEQLREECARSENLQQEVSRLRGENQRLNEVIAPLLSRRSYNFLRQRQAPVVCLQRVHLKPVHSYRKKLPNYDLGFKIRYVHVLLRAHKLTHDGRKEPFARKHKPRKLWKMN